MSSMTVLRRAALALRGRFRKSTSPMVDCEECGQRIRRSTAFSNGYDFCSADHAEAYQADFAW